MLECLYYFFLLFCLQMLALKYQNMSATNSSYGAENNFALFENFKVIIK